MAAITAIPYEPKYRAQWDEFVAASNNGTMFHLQQFLDYHSNGKFDFHHLLFFDDQKLIAVLPGGLIAPGVYESPIGASYGGFVVHDMTFDECLGLVDALLGYATTVGWHDISLTAAPFVYQATLTQSIDFALLWRGFAYDTHYISSVIDLRRHKDDPLDRFSSSARRIIRRSQRAASLRIEQCDDYEGFYPVLVENKARHGVRPTHTLADLHRLRELLPGQFILFNAYLDDEPIAGALNFVANPRVLLIFYIMMLYAHEEHNPAYMLMHQVTRYALDHGFWYVDIGVSQDTKAVNPMTPSEDLIRFKERFDAHGVMRSTLRWRSQP